jgi:hypothetical protein
MHSFPWLFFPWNGPLHLSSSFNTTTLVKPKPMNEEEKEVLLEDLHVHQNYLAQDRHDA